MRLANLQLHMLVACFVAMHDDVTLCDASGRVTSKLPQMDMETWVSDRPKGDVFLKLTRGASVVE